MALVFVPHPQVATAGWTDMGPEDSWSVYILEVYNRAAVVGELRRLYSKDRPLTRFLDRVSNPPIKIPVSIEIVELGFFNEDMAEIERMPGMWGHYETLVYEKAVVIANRFRKLGAHVIVVPNHISFQYYFEQSTIEDQEKLIYHLDYFTK